MESLMRLKTDYIDLYQLHHYDPTVPIEDTIDALERLVDSGKIRSFGFLISHQKTFPTFYII